MRTMKDTLLVVSGMMLSGCGYNTIQVQDEATKSAWSEVLNQYQRRADLIPNLVNTVKGFAAQEQAVLIGVTEARAKATQITGGCQRRRHRWHSSRRRRASCRARCRD